MSILAPDGAAVATLLLMRVTGLVWVAPLLSNRAIPVAVRSGVALLLVAMLWPTAAATSSGAQVTPTAILGELLVGIVLGLAALVFVAAAEAAGDILAIQTGLSGATALDPASGAHLPTLGQFLGLLMLACILSVGGHRTILGALDGSLRAAPLGAPLALDQGALAAAELGSRLFVIGLRIAAPVVAALTLGNVALGILSRAAPQLNVLALAFPLQIGLGLLVLGATLQVVFADVAGWSDTYREVAAPLLRRLAPGSGG